MIVENESRSCASKDHAPDINSSCGVTLPWEPIGAALRCDLKPGHRRTHHCCGEHWEVNW